MQRLYKLNKLLENTPEKFYWLGFLVADGHFSNTGRLQVTLALEDYAHLQKLATWLGDFKVKIWGGTCSLAVMDVSTVKELQRLYKIQSNKTENPPDLSILTEEQLFCFKVGFIDGDGSIQKQTGRNDCKITIKCHKNWLKFFKDNFSPKSHVNAAGYAYCGFANIQYLQELKKRSQQLQLPVLERKWDLIDTTTVSKTVKALELKNKISDLLKIGKKCKEISEILGQNYTTVYMIIQRNKL